MLKRVRPSPAADPRSATASTSVEPCCLSGNRINMANARVNQPWRGWECFAMKGHRVNRRSLLIGMALAPAVIGAARAQPMTLRLSSSLPNDPKFANGRVYYDNLVKHLAADGLADQIDVQFFPDNQLGQEIDVVNSVKPRRHRPDGHRHLDLGQRRAPDRHARPRLPVRELPAADQGARRRRRQAARAGAASRREHPNHRLGV